MNDFYYVEEIIKPQLEKLAKENERLIIQLQTTEEMARNYKYKLWENENKMSQLKHIISKIK